MIDLPGEPWKLITRDFYPLIALIALEPKEGDLHLTACAVELIHDVHVVNVVQKHILTVMQIELDYPHVMSCIETKTNKS